MSACLTKESEDDAMFSNVSKFFKKRPFIFFIAPSAILYLLLILYPMFSSIFNSFTLWDGIGDKEFVGLQNFITLFSNSTYAPQLGNALKNGLIFSVLSYVVEVPVAFYFAIMLDKKIRFSKACQAIIFLPQVISTVAVSLLVSLFFDPTFGVINTVLRTVGLNSWAKPWLGNPILMQCLVVFIIVWKGIGIPTMLILSNMQAIPQDYTEAASLDGASEWKVFWKIKLPLLIPSLMNTMVLTFLGSFAAFDVPFMLGGKSGGPSNCVDTLGTLFYRVAFGSPYLSNTMGLATAIAVIQLVIALTISIFQIKLLRNKLIEY